MTTLSLDEFQQNILQREVRAFLQGVTDPEVQARYAALLQQVESGEVAEELLLTLTGLLEIVLESGRARKLYGPAGENTLTALFQKTPQGAALQQQATAVNQALKGLEDQSIKSVAFRPSKPGSWVLTMQTDRCELTLRIDRKAIHLSNLEVDLG